MHFFKQILVLSLVLITGCSEQDTTKSDAGGVAPAESSSILSFEKYQLDNGLTVVFHIDRSDPVVAVALTSHVGSARELPGRTGFAHLFEHLLFLESENLGKGGLDKLSARIGGSGANGSTSRDRTNYFQTVPKDALEKMIWAEADKLGYFINTVTDPVLAKEKQVVKNEKRQSVDNQPYGHVSYVVGKNIYPEDHPYNWQVIGSLEDLQNATLQDVKDFYNRWYVPNNVTLAIAGDFDPEQARQWVQKYFGEIPRGEETPPLEKRASPLSETKRFFYEDNFAQLPELRLTWPTVHQYHPDMWALDVLTQYLSQGKEAPLNKVIVDEAKLGSSVFMGSQNAELAGEMILLVRAFPGTNLNDVKAAFDTAFERFESEGISERDLNRIKTSQEVSFFGGIGSVLGKAFQMAQYEIFAGDPGFINQDIASIRAVTADDIMRVYNTYIKDRPYIATSFVPQGQTDGVLVNSVPADVVEEAIVQGAEDEVDASIVATYERSLSSFDRTVEPPYGEPATVEVPTIWETKLTGDLKVYGIENSELPLVAFDMTIKGGQLMDNVDKVGVANLTATLMTRGTANKTPAELEVAIEELGANISINASAGAISINGSTLARNYAATMALVTEMLLEPRWDTEEFELAKLSVQNALNAQLSNPNSIAANQYAKLLYGDGHILSQNILGSIEVLDTITLDELKNFYDRAFAPNITTIHIVGAVNQTNALTPLTELSSNWAPKDVTIPEYTAPTLPDTAQVYFYDVPGAKQSVLYFGHPSLSALADDYYPAQVMNYILGGGGFASRLMQELREGKGYTYGIGSSFSGTARDGAFTISSGVRSNVTYEASQLVKDILDNYGATFTEADLDVTQNFLLKSKARAFETLQAKLGLLSNISTYGWPYDYVNTQDDVIKNMSIEEIQRLADTYIRPDKMIYLIVGDAETQLERMDGLGFGAPVRLN